MSSNSQQVPVPERKGEVAELQRLLQNIQVLRDKVKLREVIKKVLAYLVRSMRTTQRGSAGVQALKHRAWQQKQASGNSPRSLSCLRDGH